MGANVSRSRSDYLKIRVSLRDLSVLRVAAIASGVGNLETFLAQILEAQAAELRLLRIKPPTPTATEWSEDDRELRANESMDFRRIFGEREVARLRNLAEHTPISVLADRFHCSVSAVRRVLKPEE